MSSQSNLRDILLTLVIGTSESDLRVRNSGTQEHALAKKCGDGNKEKKNVYGVATREVNDENVEYV